MHTEILRPSNVLIESLEPRRLLSGGSTFLSNAEFVRALILAGHSGGAWNGAGITSSSSAATPGDPSTSFNGITISTDSVFTRVTRYGDANLNGVVNLADFNRLAGNFGSTSSLRDFNYDGVVNLADFNLLAANFGLSSSANGVTGHDWASLSVATTGQPAYFVEGRTLVVLGSPKADRIIVDRAKLQEMQRLYPSADIRRISVDAGAGDDFVEIKVPIISTVSGARGNDTIIGSSKNDILSGGAGNDLIRGGGGDDLIEGLDGNDRLEGGPGNDSISGGKGNDSLLGNDGDDVLSGGGGTDWMYGGRGRDTFKAADILGNRDRIGFDRKTDTLLGSDPDDEFVRNMR